MLRFNRAALKRDLIRTYQQALQGFVDKVTREAETAKPVPPSPGIPQIMISKRDAEVVGWLIVGHVMALGGWAVASEFGTGSLMESARANPGLAKYISSATWNPARPRQTGAPIMGRPRGNYVDLFGRKRWSRGTATGRNLEGRFRPIKGTGWFRIIFKLNQVRFRRHCMETLKAFPMHKYITSGSSTAVK